MTVNKAVTGNFQKRVQGSTTGRNGAFAPGDAILYTFDSSDAINPLTITGFEGPGISAGGLNIQADQWGQFTARIEAFDATSTSLGFFDVVGTSSNTPNTAPFIGVTSDTPIASLLFSVVAGGNGARASYAINQFDFTPVPGPLPVLGAGAAFGFSRKLRGRVKATRSF